MSQDCARWRDDLGAYVIGALEAAEHDAMRAHITTCAACHDDFEYLLPVRDWLASARQRRDGPPEPAGLPTGCPAGR